MLNKCLCVWIGDRLHSLGLATTSVESGGGLAIAGNTSGVIKVDKRLEAVVGFVPGNGKPTKLTLDADEDAGGRARKEKVNAASQSVWRLMGVTGL